MLAADVLRGDGSVLPTRLPSRLYAPPFAFLMSSLEPDYTPRVLRCLQHEGHQMEARLMPHAQYVAVVIVLDGQACVVKDFDHQT